MQTPPPLTVGTALSSWTFATTMTIVFVVLGVGYALLARRHDGHWPRGRTAFFLAGSVLGLLAVNSFIGVYAMTLYWVHMIQHLMLIMVVPACYVLARPLTLIAEISPRAREILRGRVVSAITMPGLSLALYTVVLVGTHLTTFMATMRDNPWLHPVEAALYLISGYLFFLTLLVREPLRWELSYPLRLFLMMTAMSVDTIVGVILMMTVSDPLAASGMMMRDWGPTPAGDLHAGGAIMWVFGDTLMLIPIIAVIGRWLSDPAGGGMGRWLESARSQHLAEVSGVEQTDATIDDDEASLKAYNEMLQRLNHRS